MQTKPNFPMVTDTMVMQMAATMSYRVWGA